MLVISNRHFFPKKIKIIIQWRCWNFGIHFIWRNRLDHFQSTEFKRDGSRKWHKFYHKTNEVQIQTGKTGWTQVKCSTKLNQSTNQSIIIASIERDGKHSIQSTACKGCVISHMNHEFVVNQHLQQPSNTHTHKCNTYLRRFSLKQKNTDQFEGNNQENCNGHISVAVSCPSIFSNVYL